MSMNDEQFEQELQFLSTLASPPLIEQIRARDIAQREALARAEAERDQWQTAYWKQHRITGEAQAQLAEAVGLLRKVVAWPAEECTYGQEQVQEAACAFLVRHAQADQQEALSESELMEVAMFVGSGNKAARRANAIGAAELPEHLAPNQEAQGAQAGYETPIPEYFQEACDKFDWTPEEALRFYAEGKHFDTDRGRTRILDTGGIASNALKHASLAYLEMKGDAELSELRAALATQPAAGEPVAWMYDTPNNGRQYSDKRLDHYWWDALKDSYVKGVPLYAAPPASAHGDEAVLPERKPDPEGHWVEMGDAYNDGWNSCLDKIAAMRAQGDGE